jgi:hypothetical protein
MYQETLPDEIVSIFILISGICSTQMLQLHGQLAFIICQCQSNIRRWQKIMEHEKEQIRDILTWLSRNFSDRMILACVVDEKAKLIDYQKGIMQFGRTTSKHSDINIKISLIFSLAKQFEDFAGPLAHSVITYDNHEVVIMDISGTILYIICTVGSASDIVDELTRRVEDVPVREETKKWQVTHHDQDFISSDWSGR